MKTTLVGSLTTYDPNTVHDKDGTSGGFSFCPEHGIIRDLPKRVYPLYIGDQLGRDNEVMQDDIADLLDALMLGSHARPISPHQVMQEVIIPHVKNIMDGGGYAGRE